ncbi:50S ribosomal protein L17 [Candidatus Contubernalis alkaliaceticus]|uniref:50S ribosomal protein L17 n=1 Tax=Candidatus Contubernalis alkaliaceticus TaxID=338645 RepID=UPI001F4BEFAD|nr:50S ribosomal protein L17 [Candidatus Contubernalis alkalaceticus]UNC90964.1 50S ribosomal protein L17 [Candidatus Contubernalis alkalaceticus]
MAYRKFGRSSNQRRAMLRNMVTSLILAERIETTEAKAKTVRRIADKMITLGKRGDLHAQRQALSYMLDEDAVYKLFHDIAPKYEDRQGGYTRVLKKGPRRGDSAPMAILELV